MTLDNLAVIGRRVGNYVVERNLAHGGMGAVFVARHPALGREAAVKFLGQEFETTPELTKRFLAEARITANLRHPNIVDIFDFGELDGRLYYVMELLKGCDLSELLKQRKRFPPTEVIEVLVQIASGLEAAHALGVVHRDLKPANVFVLEGEPLHVKLMDFGIAKVLSSAGEHTSYGQIIGTPRYMSPEQALGQADRISPKSDYYSLGVIAYEMLAGVAPFEHASAMMMLIMHVRDTHHPLQQLVPDCPPGLAELVESCLAKDPAERPATASELVERLRGLRRDIAPSSQPSEPRLTPADRAASPARATPDARSRLGSDDTLPTSQLQFAQPTPESPATPTPPVPLVAKSAIAPESKPHGAVTPPPPAVAVTPPPPAVAVTPPPPAVAVTPPPPAAEPSLAPSRRGFKTLDLVALSLPPSVDLSEPEGHTETVRLSDSDRNVLNRLLLRMQRKGDFPAFAQNVGEVNRRSEVDGSFSAEQLGTSILKDYALTAKLLRYVNSTYANRFGGKIYSVQHAIVILGFDRVRQIALSISLFKSTGKKEHAERISESAVNSLVSSEISRQLHREADIDDPEQAVVCSLFRNLGRHLVLVYLPELYDQIVNLMETEGISQNKASERVLGLSMQKLGVGIAERWRLPQGVIHAMSVVPERSGRIYRAEDRVSALAEFSNQLSEIVAGDLDSETKRRALDNLALRHRHLLAIDDNAMTELLVTVQQSFERRYASLLGVGTRSNRFSRNVSSLVEPTEDASADKATAPSAPPPSLPLPHITASSRQELQRAVAQIALSERPAQPSSGPPVGTRSKRAVAKLQLAKTSVEPTPSKPEPQDAAQMANLLEFRATLTRLQARADRAETGATELCALLAAIATLFGLPRVLLLKPDAALRELSACAGVGEDMEGLTKELRLPLAPSRSAVDPFSVAFHMNRAQLIEDTFTKKVANVMPARYYETLGSTSVLLMHVPNRAGQPYVLLVDWDPPRQPPSQPQIAEVSSARPLVARLAQGAARV